MSAGIGKEELVDIVGKGNVYDDPETLDLYARDESFLPARRPSFVVKPRGTDEIVALLKLANETRTPLIPVSSSPPHFRGDTVPEYGGIVLDFSGMNRILFVDREDRVAMIEPGVRFGELQDALPRWILFFCISGYRILPEERVSILEKETREVAKFCDATLQKPWRE